MPTTTISKIQVRRGPLSDLPILDEGEFGYALDYHRLFIGNTPITFTGNAQIKRYTIQDRTILPDQISVLVDNSEVNIGVEYSLEETDIVFANAPHAAEEIAYTVIGRQPNIFVGDGNTDSVVVQNYSEGNELVVVSYKNIDPPNHLRLEAVKIFASTDPLHPNEIQLSSTVGVQTGQLFVVLGGNLPGLISGRNYYIRNISGNFIKISSTEDPGSPTLTFSQTAQGLSYVRVGGELLQSEENYTFDGSNLTFLDGSIPEGAAEIKINFNTEVKIQETSDPHFRLPLNELKFAATDTGLSFSLAEANTAQITYSLRTSDNILRVGTLNIISDGVASYIYDTSNSSSNTGIVFSLGIASGRLHLRYTNTRNQSANFYYSVKLWNTI
jgi:hypothetical protein